MIKDYVEQLSGYEINVYDEFLLAELIIEREGYKIIESYPIDNYFVFVVNKHIMPNKLKNINDLIHLFANSSISKEQLVMVLGSINYITMTNKYGTMHAVNYITKAGNTVRNIIEHKTGGKEYTSSKFKQLLNKNVKDD